MQAQDHGATQQNTGYGTLTVTISDVNDNSPYFEQVMCKIQAGSRHGHNRHVFSSIAMAK